jgi:hypothetical protein
MLQRFRLALCCLLCWQLVSASLIRAQQPGLQISVLDGEGAINYVDTRLGAAPVVQVLDMQGEPVAGAEVRFNAPTTGPTVTFFGAADAAAVMTDAEGRAQAPALLPNTYTGEFIIEVTANHEGRTATALIHQTNAFADAAPKKKRRIGWRVWFGIGLAVAIGIIAAVNPD